VSGERPAGVHPPDDFRRPWLHSEEPVARLVARPLEQFLRREAGGGLLLLVAALLALGWSNAASGSYEAFWSTELTVEVGRLSFEQDLRHLVNELLIALFFYVVALEVKRELLRGDLRDPRYAVVPAAAFGTMLGAALVYVAVNLLDGGELGGWAIPVATDIAFAVAALGLVGRRAPRELRGFLLTLAIVDDLATILIIAVFFATDVSLLALGVAAATVGVVLGLQGVGVRMLAPYVLLAALLWLALLESGVHPTLAGVVLGFLTPAWSFYPRDDTGAVIADQLTDLTRASDVEISEGTMREVARLAREAASPLGRMEEQLHPWSSYLVLPLFALANAGVSLSAAGLGEALTSPLGLGILLGLVVGAPLGGIALALAVVRLTPAELPPGLDWGALAGVAPLKGIGFTVAIFIATLAFADEALVAQAKIAILLASALAGALGVAALYGRHRAQQRAGS